MTIEQEQEREQAEQPDQAEQAQPWTAEELAAIVAYLEAGAGDGTTVALNEAAWQRWAIVPRMFVDVSTVDTAWSAFGLTLRAPILAAPSAGHGLAHPRAEVATAEGARAAGLGLVLSQGSSAAVEDVAAASGPYWQQIYLPRNREILWPFLDRAVASGATALVLTVDQPALGNSHPFRAGLAALRRPVGDRSPNFPGVTQAELATAANTSLEDIGLLASRSGLPVLVKGVLHPDDAVLAVEAGARGVLVSNHGGRQIDGSLTTAEALPAVSAAVRQRWPDEPPLVLVDGGIRSGEDVLRALALGADAALVGRPVLRGLRADGADGVAAALNALAAGFERVLALSGIRSAREVSPAAIRPRWTTENAT